MDSNTIINNYLSKEIARLHIEHEKALSDLKSELSIRDAKIKGLRKSLQIAVNDNSKLVKEMDRLSPKSIIYRIL